MHDLFRPGAEFEHGNRLSEQAIAVMERQGTIVIDGLTTGADLVSWLPNLRLNNYELPFAYEVYLRRRGPSSPVKSFAELVATGRYLDGLRGRFEEALSRPALDFDPGYLARFENRSVLQELLVTLMDRYRVDALVYPFKSLGAPPVGTADSGPRDNPLASVSGLPAIVVPAGMNDEGLPIAIEFLGRPFSESTLIRVAHAYERASQRRIAPKSTPHLPGEVFRY